MSSESEGVENVFWKTNKLIFYLSNNNIISNNRSYFVQPRNRNCPRHLPPFPIYQRFCCRRRVVDLIDEVQVEFIDRRRRRQSSHNVYSHARRYYLGVAHVVRRNDLICKGDVVNHIPGSTVAFAATPLR